MYNIRKATKEDFKILSKVSKDSFLPAHGHSAPKEDIENYISQNFSEENFIKELLDENNQYYLLYIDDQIAGYSKIILNQPNSNISAKNITYMSRIYLLEEFYGLNLGNLLFDFNLLLCKENNQKGIWLAVWVENKKAISFYKKRGFEKVGDFDFKISETHSNPNHILYLSI